MPLGNVTWGNVLPLLAILVPALAGLFGYLYQEHARRQAALGERRQKLYEELVGSLIALLGATSGSARSALMTKIEQGWLFASDEVLAACYEYLVAFDSVCQSSTGEDGVLRPLAVMARLRDDPGTRRLLGDRLYAIFQAMRRDLRGDSEFETKNFQIYSWGVLSEEPSDPRATAV